MWIEIKGQQLNLDNVGRIYTRGEDEYPYLCLLISGKEIEFSYDNPEERDSAHKELMKLINIPRIVEKGYKL
jgi:hypothetical protein